MNRKLRNIFAFVLVVLTSVFISACSTGQSSIDEATSESLMYSAEQMFTQVVGLDDETIDQYIDQFNYEQDTIYANGFNSWKTAKTELGEFVGITDYDIKKDSGGYTVTFTVQFEKRDCEFVFGTDLQMRELTEIEFNPVYTLGEKLGQAGVNLVIGMGTVFVVLAFLTLIISLFKYVNKAEAYLKSKDEKKTEDKAEENAQMPEAQPEEPEEQLQDQDDEELRAVIAAAIAAYEEDCGQKIEKQAALENGLSVRSYRRGGVR